MPKSVPNVAYLVRIKCSLQSYPDERIDN